jgi:hypothetical protein
MIGTIDYIKLHDPLGLYWKPRPIKDANNILFHIAHYTDFLALQEGYSSSRIKPYRQAKSYEERLNCCAYNLSNKMFSSITQQTITKKNYNPIK